MSEATVAVGAMSKKKKKKKKGSKCKHNSELNDSDSSGEELSVDFAILSPPDLDSNNTTKVGSDHSSDDEKQITDKSAKNKDRAAGLSRQNDSDDNDDKTTAAKARNDDIVNPSGSGHHHSSNKLASKAIRDKDDNDDDKKKQEEEKLPPQTKPGAMIISSDSDKEESVEAGGITTTSTTTKDLPNNSSDTLSVLEAAIATEQAALIRAELSIPLLKHKVFLADKGDNNEKKRVALGEAKEAKELYFVYYRKALAKYIKYQKEDDQKEAASNWCVRGQRQEGNA